MSASMSFRAFPFFPQFSSTVISERKRFNTCAGFLSIAALVWFAGAAFWAASGATLSFEAYIAGLFALVVILLGFLGLLIKRWFLMVARQTQKSSGA